MYNYRKVKSSFFLRDLSYPEMLLSKHKYYKRSGLYTSLNFPVSLTPHNNNEVFQVSNERHALSLSYHSTLLRPRKSKMLLEGVSHLHLNCSTNRKDEGSQGKFSSRKGRMINLPPTRLGVTNNITISSTFQKRSVSKKKEKELQGKKGDRQHVETARASQMHASQSDARETVNSQDIRVDDRGLMKMDSLSFTNGLLNVGCRYFSVL